VGDDTYEHGQMPFRVAQQRGSTKGGNARMNRLTRDERSDLASLGGTARRDRYGVEALHELGRKSAEKTRGTRREHKPRIRKFQQLSEQAAALAADENDVKSDK